MIVPPRRVGAFFHQTSAGLMETSPAGRILVANPPCGRILGRSPEELLTLHWMDLIHPDDRPALAAQFGQCLDKGLGFVVENRYLRQWGPPVWVRTSGSRVPGAEGQPPSILITLCDFTEHKQIEDVLVEADRRKNEFLATLAHEMRNPMACMTNSLEILKRANAEPEQWVRATSTMERQLSQMRRLIDDILDIASISRGKLELHWEPVSLAGVLQDAVEGVRPQIERARHDLVMTLPSEPVTLRADPHRLVQVFANLLTNSCKYTEPGGRISVTAERNEGDVVVSIKDTGIGIAPEDLPRLFTMFTQASSGHGRAKGGLGIGLALARGLAEIHGGHLTAHSDGPGRGSEFIVRLPMAGPPRVLALELRPGRVDGRRPAAASKRGEKPP